MNARVLGFVLAVFLFLPSSLLAQSDVQLYTDDASDEPNTSVSINEYMSNGWSEESEMAVPLLGITVREEIGQLANGARISGLGVMGVSSGSPANSSGIGAPHTLLRTAAVMALMAGGLVFPPAMMGAMVLSDSGIGDAHDLIVAVDGYRTHTLYQFRAAIGRARPGQIVYLRVIRGGEPRGLRIEIPGGAGLGLN